jgi:hypothetical protein
MTRTRWSQVLTLAMATLAAVSTMSFLAPAIAAGQTVTVYKTPTCGCCTEWVGHLQTQGFSVTATDVSTAQLTAVKNEQGIPPRLRSCHTGMVGNYVIEGHVPGSIIFRLLQEKPAVAGLAVPGMPIGSPGMEGPNPQPYEVFSFDRAGQVHVYERVVP